MMNEDRASSDTVEEEMEISSVLSLSETLDSLVGRLSLNQSANNTSISFSFMGSSLREKVFGILDSIVGVEKATSVIDQSDDGFEDVLIDMIGANLVSSLLDFISVLNDVLRDNDPLNVQWNQKLITEVGGRGTLFNLWERLRKSDRVHCRKRKRSCDDEDIEQDLQKKTKIVDSSVGDADIMLNSLAVHDDTLLDPQPGPSRRDQLSPPRENLLNQDSSVDSFDSAFDKNNEYNQLKLEQTDTQIEKNIRGDTSRQCTSDISVAFDEPPQDISQESATSVVNDEGVSLAHSITVDGVPGVSKNPGDEVLEEGGLIRAVRLMDGLKGTGHPK